MKYEDLDRLIARFALENGYTIKTATRKLLWKYINTTEELLRYLGSSIDIVEQKDFTIDQLKKFLAKRQG